MDLAAPSASPGPAPIGLTPGPSGPSGAPPRKQRVSLACRRCKRRKQRCNGGQPDCLSCRKVGAECVYERAIRPRYPGGKSLYISALEERIAWLEERMPEYGQDHFLPPEEPRARQASSDSEEGKSPLVDGVAYLSLCASGTTDTAPEPFYVGSSSGATIARLIQGSIFRATKSRLAGPQPINNVLRPTLSELERHMTVPSSMSVDRSFPPRAQAETLLAVFFDRLHTRWPILDRRLFKGVFEQEGPVSVVHGSLLHLVYAITARFLQLMKKSCEVDPAKHFAAAIEPMDHILEQHNLATVQFLALLAIYGQRSPYGAGSWSQVRYATTLCIELGLHRRQTTPETAAEREIRRRVFWACYCLDRMTTITLGRTFAIADRDINCELPSDSPDLWHLTAGTPEEFANIRPFNHIIKLRRLQSKLFRTVWRVDRDILHPTDTAEKEKLDRKIETVKAELDQWKEDIPLPSQGAKTTWMYDPESACHDSLDYFNLQYHKTVLSLFTALLPALPPTDSRFLSATRSAAAVCTAYRNLEAQKTLSYTVVALHSCFIAGLTLVYCLWREPSLFNYGVLEATRACSLCLTIFGERWPGAVKYRDIFDAMSGSLLKSIMGDERRARQPLDVRVQPEPAPPVDEQARSEDVLLGAVKDAFMELDGEAPGTEGGGWQGWRMFNEMVQSDMSTGEAGSFAAGGWDVGDGQEAAWGWDYRP